MTAQAIPFAEILLDPQGSIPIESYPDGMPLVRYASSLIDVWPYRMLVRPKSLSSFMTAMFFVDAMEERGMNPPKLILPCVPGARQDRLNPTGDYLFTSKSIATEINSRAFPTVTILDPHSDVMPALITRARVIQAYECIRPPAGKYAAVVSPDAGAEKRASAVARKLGVPLLHGWKVRDIGTGAISGFGMQEHDLPADSLVLVVDDLCDAGGTFLGLADVLDARRLKAHLWVTHGLFTNGTSHLLERYGHIYCTDSVDGPRDGVIQIDVCTTLLNGGKLP